MGDTRGARALLATALMAAGLATVGPETAAAAFGEFPDQCVEQMVGDRLFVQDYTRARLDDLDIGISANDGQDGPVVLANGEAGRFTPYTWTLSGGSFDPWIRYVTFDNQAMYTGDQARFYAPIAQLCPNANIHLDTTNITGDRGGVFSWQHGITIDPADMAARVDEPEISKLGTAIHECAHMKQFYNWGGTRDGLDVMEARSAAVFVADNDPAGPTVPMAPDWAPLEHAADCAKELISPERYRTYGGYCNPTEYAAAGLLWQNQQY